MSDTVGYKTDRYLTHSKKERKKNNIEPDKYFKCKTQIRVKKPLSQESLF